MRRPGLTPENMDDEQQMLYQTINSGDRAKNASLTNAQGALIGPYNTWFPSINGLFHQSPRQSAGSLVRRGTPRLRAIP